MAYAYVGLSRDRAFLSPSLAKIAFRKLDAGVEASGPHDFAVRKQNALVKAPLVPPHQPRVRDDAIRPRVGGRRRIMNLLRFRKSEYLSEGWTVENS